jgi:galactosamine-6-phosphate isomerase
MLQPQVFPDHEAVSRHAAEWIAELLRERPTSLLCLASGATPRHTYQLLVENGSREPSLVNQCRILKLDEWGGLPIADPATCEKHLQSEFVMPLGLADRYVGFDSNPQDAQAECTLIAAWLERNGPIDICVLGLGTNGHIGFNEPAASLQPHAHVAELSAASLSHAMITQSAVRPTYGLTLGMADLLQSRHVVLLVTGTRKRRPLEQLLSGQISTQFPASLLQLHPSVQLLCDAACYTG